MDISTYRELSFFHSMLASWSLWYGLRNSVSYFAEANTRLPHTHHVVYPHITQSDLTPTIPSLFLFVDCSWDAELCGLQFNSPQYFQSHLIGNTNPSFSSYALAILGLPSQLPLPPLSHFIVQLPFCLLWRLFQLAKRTYRLRSLYLYIYIVYNCCVTILLHFCYRWSFESSALFWDSQKGCRGENIALSPYLPIRGIEIYVPFYTHIRVFLTSWCPRGSINPHMREFAV